MLHFSMTTPDPESKSKHSIYMIARMRELPFAIGCSYRVCTLDTDIRIHASNIFMIHVKGGSHGGWDVVHMRMKEQDQLFVR